MYGRNGGDHLGLFMIWGAVTLNIINIFVILGATALIYPISSQKQSRRFDIPWSALGAVLILMLSIPFV